MKQVKVICRVLKNKYLITITALAVWVAFFDRNDFFTQYDLAQQVKKLEIEKAYYLKEISANKTAIKELQSNPRSLEKFARETYRMKKENEDLFVLVSK